MNWLIDKYEKVKMYWNVNKDKYIKKLIYGLSVVLILFTTGYISNEVISKRNEIKRNIRSVEVAAKIANEKIFSDDVDYSKYSIVEDYDVYSIYKNDSIKERKEKLLKDVVINETENRSINDVLDYICYIPDELITLMVNDGVKIRMSNEAGPKEDIHKTLAYYNDKFREIVLYNEPSYYSLVHEIGHWFNFYIERNLDEDILFNISVDMVNELESILYLDFHKEYYTSNLSETFAAIFDLYFRQNSKIEENAPNIKKYMEYYTYIALNL